jgi:hypothetical protein
MLHVFRTRSGYTIGKCVFQLKPSRTYDVRSNHIHI